MSFSSVATRLVATTLARSAAASRASSKTLPQIMQKHAATTKMAIRRNRGEARDVALAKRNVSFSMASLAHPQPRAQLARLPWT